MKKYYILLGILGLLFGYLAKTNYWFEDERDVFFPITKAQLKVKKSSSTSALSMPTGSSPQATAQNFPVVDLATLSQADLFNELYNNKVLNHSSHQQTYFEMIRARLTSKYPAENSLKHAGTHDREVANRLGLLRAMAQFWPTPHQINSVEQKTVKNFFASIAKDKTENIMIRRQAYKNWLMFGDPASQTEKTRMATNSDTRLLHLVSLSDENLIESLTESAE